MIQPKFVEQPSTMIYLQVNGRSVPFTFVGEPSAKYMECTRKLTEEIERATVIKSRKGE